MKKLSLVGVALLFVSVSTVTLAQNLVQNGSFELPGVGFQQPFSSGSDIAGWTVSGSGDVGIMNGPANGGDYGPAQNGSDYLDLSGFGTTHAYVYQDLSTVPGLTYSLAFYTGSSSYNPEQTIKVSLFENDLGYILNTTLTPLAPSGSINWKEETFTFTAAKDSTRLQFMDTSGFDDNASYVDNVSVTEVPEPTMLLPFGLAVLVWWRRR